MPDLSLTVNNHLHTISCEAGQEPRLRRLAQLVDARIGDFVATIGQAGEARLLLLAALTLADQLADTGEAAQSERGRHEASLAAVAGTIEALASRLEAIAVELETP